MKMSNERFDKQLLTIEEFEFAASVGKNGRQFHSFNMPVFYRSYKRSKNVVVLCGEQGYVTTVNIARLREIYNPFHP
jgi:hypothetical protein